jgi:hypothetical protein
MKMPLFILVLLGPACGGHTPPVAGAIAPDVPAPLVPPAADDPPPSVPSAPPSPAACSDPDSCGLRVQEWGTYTSVQASDGHALGGVHHEDERLPAWVHRRDWGPDAYYVEMLPEEPLQQLETPVLYFWSAKATPVHVTVEFPRGVVGQWYPAAETFAPELQRMTALAGGSMSWQLTVDPAVKAETFQGVDPDEIWAPSRHVASTPVRWTSPTGEEEREQFIFYRGLGMFDPPIRIVASDDGQLRIANPSKETARAAFVLRVAGGRGRITRLGPLAAGVTTAAPIPGADDDLDSYLAAARAMLEEALVGSGLEADVARAMVDTWSRSWFRNPGLRVLYLAPRAWTEAWLPTTITPAPSAFVRTLVGRIEILTPDEERGLVALLRDRQTTGVPFELAPLGRFAEPRLRRAAEMLTRPEEIAYAQAQVQWAHGQR